MLLGWFEKVLNGRFCNFIFISDGKLLEKKGKTEKSRATATATAAAATAWVHIAKFRADELDEWWIFSGYSSTKQSDLNFPRLTNEAGNTVDAAKGEKERERERFLPITIFFRI